jgi:hypothetical protein
MEYYNSDGSPMALEQRAELQRSRRNKFLFLYIDAMNPVRWSTYTTEQQQSWINYRQALLDVPQQSGFPDEIVWPQKPE